MSGLLIIIIGISLCFLYRKNKEIIVTLGDDEFTMEDSNNHTIEMEHQPSLVIPATNPTANNGELLKR